MAGEIVNLRMARKQKQRSEREELAAKNRFEHGRTKTERETAGKENLRSQRLLDAGRREPVKKADTDGDGTS